MKKLAIVVLVYAALALPASAGHRYHYWIQAQAIPPPANVTIPIGTWTASWESDTLLTSAACPGIDVTALPGFSVQATGYTLTSLFFCTTQDSHNTGYPTEFDGTWTTTSSNAISPMASITQFFCQGPAPQPLSPGSYPDSCTDYSFYPYDLVGLPEAIAPTKLVIIDTWVTPPPMPHWLGSVIRLSLTAGPLTPLPGSPVEAVVGLTSLSGAPIGQSQTVPLVSGQVTSVDFDLNSMDSGVGGHNNVVPLVTLVGSLLPAVQTTVEVFDRLTGFGGALATANGAAPPSSQLAPQGLARGQIMRLIATAGSPNPCMATLGFANKMGTSIGPAVTVDLSPGQSQALDLDAGMLALRFGQRAEVQPMVKISPVVPGAAPINPVCSVSSEVFDIFTGRTWTYQNAYLQ